MFGLLPESFTRLLLYCGLCALCVPVVGPEVVLTLLLVPPAILRTATPSLAAYPILSAIAGLIGGAGAFVLSCAEGVDWPPGPAVVLCVVATSAVLAGVVAGTRCAMGRTNS